MFLPDLYVTGWLCTTGALLTSSICGRVIVIGLGFVAVSSVMLGGKRLTGHRDRPTYERR
jgi:hypothetical protein